MAEMLQVVNYYGSGCFQIGLDFFNRAADVFLWDFFYVVRSQYPAKKTQAYSL